MTQHIEEFLQECTTVTADGTLASLDEVEGLYLYWSSLRAVATSDGTDEADPTDTSAVLDALRSRGVEPAQRDGVDYLEGLVLTGPVMTDFILSCDFTGAWGHPDVRELEPAGDVAAAS
ncbi:hypothetical protein CVO76_08505 [Arthrobacter agilis]|uniref:Uncharacterized protein n=1 Tax=Arthrobacter agilis TaxID=37921 RepID=A0A2L0UEI1_9MICC|nr:hypothetical protein [Arthrobacter agilis]AUZ87664.1 hypothetical protein CVO76_08505 [Arthrobacter agilis]